LVHIAADKTREKENLLNIIKYILMEDERKISLVLTADLFVVNVPFMRG
jgi:hypothetical protein